MKDEPKQKKNTKRKTDDVTEHPQYHKTETLLWKYRDVVWSVESSVQQVRSDFQVQFGVDIEGFLNAIEDIGADLSDTDIESHAKSINRSQNMIRILETSIDRMRRKHKRGEEYYWILYYTFLSPQQLRNAGEIVEKLYPHVRSISYTTYFRKRRVAIDVLSSMMWGYTSRDCIDIVKKFFPE